MNNHTEYSVEEKIKKAAHALAPDQAFSEELWKKMATSAPQPAKDSTLMERFFKRPAWSLAALALTLMLILITTNPQRVLAVFQSLFAYLPGIGFVDGGDGTIALAAPISVEQDGVTLIIDQAVADANKTVVSYSIEGVDEGSNGFADCVYSSNSLQLADGRTLLPIGGGLENLKARIEFAALPAGVNTATLLAERSDEGVSCNAPLSWSVEIPFDAALPVENLAPVYEAPEIQVVTPAENAASVAVNPAVDDMGITFIVERLAVLEQGYLLVGHAEWVNKAWQNVRIDPESVTLTDANGKNIPLEPADEGSQDSMFAFNFEGKDLKSPLILHIGSVTVWHELTDRNTFTVETGEDPQIGQQWEINQDFDFDGQQPSILTMEAIDADGILKEGPAKAYAFTVRKAASITNVNINLDESEAVSGYYGQSKPLDDETDWYELGFPEKIPTGDVTFRISEITYDVSGDWSVQWQIPADTTN
jgi:hypothetical protein